MGARILVADDSVTIQKVVELTFSREDYELIPARSGEEAIRKARESHPDLMLIDLVMPDKNGYEVCRTLRQDPLLKTTPIILLAGTFETFDKGEGLKVGANDFVTKPFESQTLIGKVKQLLAGQGAPVAAPAAPAAATAPAMAAVAAVPPPRQEVASEPLFDLQEETVSIVPPAAPAKRPSEPAFELREEFVAKPPAPPLSPSRAAAEPELGDLQELSLDDLTAEEEALAPGDLAAIDLEPIEATAPTAAQSPAAAPPIEAMAPELPGPAFELDLGPAPPEAEVAPFVPPPVPEPAALSAMDLGLLEKAVGAPAEPPAPAPALEMEEFGFELVAPEAARPAPRAEEFLSDLEIEAAPVVEIPAAGFIAPAPPPLDERIPERGVSALEPPMMAPPPVREAAPAQVSFRPEAQAAREAEPVAPRAPVEAALPAAPPPEGRADDTAARLSAELAPYLAREIVDRIVERVERVVWEIVPDLAEALIARELDRIKERAERRSPR